MVVIPVVYSIVDDMRGWPAGLLGCWPARLLAWLLAWLSRKTSQAAKPRQAQAPVDIANSASAA